ncbi:MAG: ABC transporter ATP-binding protein [Pseudonocardia sp.]|nr:ABC transporter ATP-binding protein [Pseudonocardia sp.]
MSDAVDVRGLTKSFGSTSVLSDLNLSVGSGEVHGFLGPNGAGKSTTIRVLLGLIRPTSGTISLLGGDPWSDAVELHRRIAYVPGDVTLWPNLTGGEIIDLLARLRGGLDAARRDALIERFELDPQKKARTYSTGNRQKVALVSALSSRADLLILDEPTSGLDPLMERTFRECLTEEKSAGRTVLLSSHILSEVEAACDRVTIIRKGRTVETGTLAQLRHLTRTTIEAELTTVPAQLHADPDIHDLTVERTTVRCQVEPHRMDAVLRILLEGGVRNLVAHPPTLEDLFLEHYQNAGAGPAEAGHGGQHSQHLERTAR